MDDATTPERFFGVVEIKDRCRVENCKRRAVAVFPVNEAGKEPGSWWLCDEHAYTMKSVIGDFADTGQTAHAYPQEILRTCAQEVGDTPCGAVATHVAMFGVRNVDGKPTLVAASVCERHAANRGANE